MENLEMCKQCGGKCCKHFGCEISPEDFKNGVTYENIKKKIDEGLISIDWWEGNVFEEIENHPLRNKEIEKVLYLRMRNIDSPIIDPSWEGGQCIALTPTGCKFSYDERPKGGRELIPNIIDDRIQCYNNTFSKKDCAIAWYEYKDILERLYNEYLENFYNNILKLLEEKGCEIIDDRIRIK